MSINLIKKQFMIFYFFRKVFEESAAVAEKSSYFMGNATEIGSSYTLV
jgi:hypothetical protein